MIDGTRIQVPRMGCFIASSTEEKLRVRITALLHVVLVRVSSQAFVGMSFLIPRLDVVRVEPLRQHQAQE